MIMNDDHHTTLSRGVGPIYPGWNEYNPSIESMQGYIISDIQINK